MTNETPEPERDSLVRDRNERLWEFDFTRDLWRCRNSNTAMSWELLLRDTRIRTIYLATEA